MKLKRVFDIHAHIYPDAIASHAVRAISEAYDGVPIQNDGRLDTLISKLDEAEIRAAAIHSVATTPHHAESINRYILGVAQAHPRRFVPFASLHPDMPDLEAAVEDVVEKGFAASSCIRSASGFWSMSRGPSGCLSCWRGVCRC